MIARFHSDALPELVRAGKYPLPNATHDFKWRNPTHSLHLYLYECEMLLGDETLQIRSGDITVTPAGVTSSYQKETPGEHWCVHFHCPAGAVGERVMEIDCHIPAGAATLAFTEQFALITRTFNASSTNESDAYFFRAEAASRLRTLLIALRNHTRVDRECRRSKSTFAWQELLGMIDSHLAQPITTEWLATRMNIGPNTLTRKFRRQYNCTVGQYVLRRRIICAQSLLVETTLTMAEIGGQIGISDPQYFNKQFRKVTGMSPSAYRDENKAFSLANLEPGLAKTGGAWKR